MESSPPMTPTTPPFVQKGAYISKVIKVIACMKTKQQYFRNLTVGFVWHWRERYVANMAIPKPLSQTFFVLVMQTPSPMNIAGQEDCVTSSECQRSPEVNSTFDGDTFTKKINWNELYFSLWDSICCDIIKDTYAVEFRTTCGTKIAPIFEGKFLQTLLLKEQKIMFWVKWGFHYVFILWKTSLRCKVVIYVPIHVFPKCFVLILDLFTSRLR